jgi:hypothetical protein
VYVYVFSHGSVLLGLPVQYSAKHDFPITLSMSQEFFCDLFPFFFWEETHKKTLTDRILAFFPHCFTFCGRKKKLSVPLLVELHNPC